MLSNANKLNNFPPAGMSVVVIVVSQRTFSIRIRSVRIHVLFLIYEAVTGRQPNEKFMEYAQMTGMILLIKRFQLLPTTKGVSVVLRAINTL